MVTLFEFDQWEFVSNKDDLREHLQEIWENRPLLRIGATENEDEINLTRQRFLEFDGSQVRARNFVGFIQHGDQLIEVYPKVFRRFPPSRDNKELMLLHIFYWFRYCQKWRFPFSKASLDAIDLDEFPELIINLISNQFLEAVTTQPLSMYQETEEVMYIPRGSINFKRYISNSLSYGKYHWIECDHEPFVFDNKVNRVIKYCSQLLLKQTKFHTNQRLLQEVIFTLHEVMDIPCTFHDVDRINLNSFFDDYSLLLDSCKIILNQRLYSNSIFDLSQWSLLFPMEYIFEDFLAGFLKTWFSNDWHVYAQKSDKYLALTPENKKVFNLQHDIFLISKKDKKIKIIIDAKYKLRNLTYKEDLKKGIAQADLYQMLSYAYKRGCTNVILVYPNLREEIPLPDHFDILPGFEGHKTIKVAAMEIPFWSFKRFKELDDKLKETISMCLANIGIN